mmetsp:Transcript_34428/g.53738  ORF Transcript_34428/g.53738 Transcript_34428/m.53738 type:complete len:89 (-) Transcript_34428:97-363(-)
MGVTGRLRTALVTWLIDTAERQSSTQQQVRTNAVSIIQGTDVYWLDAMAQEHRQSPHNSAEAYHHGHNRLRDEQIISDLFSFCFLPLL